jgi:hypothetical protein
LVIETRNIVVAKEVSSPNKLAMTVFVIPIIL